MHNKIGSYKSADTIGKSQIDLILQVYDGAIGSLKSAREAYEGSRFTDGREQMEKAKRFVTHLYTTLNMEEGGEVAENLGKLYAYIISQSYVVQAIKDLQMIDDMITVLDNLRDGWRGLKDQQTETAAGGAADTSLEPAASGTHEFTTTA